MNQIAARYKVPLLISLVISLALIALRAETFWLNALMAFIGGIFGVLFLDVEYIFSAYLIDSSGLVATRIKEYLNSKNINGLIRYFNESESTFKELSIRSALFQGLLVIFAFYVITTSSWIFVQSATLSMMATLLYLQLIELNETKTLKRWFWIYSGDPSTRFYYWYILIIFLLLLVQFSFVR